MTATRVRVDRSLCRGSGTCVRRAPDTFHLDEEGRAVARDPARDPEPRLREAADGCPFFAIRLEPDSGG